MRNNEAQKKYRLKRHKCELKRKRKRRCDSNHDHTLDYMQRLRHKIKKMEKGKERSAFQRVVSKYFNKKAKTKEIRQVKVQTKKP